MGYVSMLLLPVQFRQNQLSLQKGCVRDPENSLALWQMPGYFVQGWLQTAEMICMATARAYSDFVLSAL